MTNFGLSATIGKSPNQYSNRIASILRNANTRISKSYIHQLKNSANRPEPLPEMHSSRPPWTKQKVRPIRANETSAPWTVWSKSNRENVSTQADLVQKSTSAHSIKLSPFGYWNANSSSCVHTIRSLSREQCHHEDGPTYYTRNQQRANWRLYQVPKTGVPKILNIRRYGYPFPEKTLRRSQKRPFSGLLPFLENKLPHCASSEKRQSRKFPRTNHRSQSSTLQAILAISLDRIQNLLKNFENLPVPRAENENRNAGQNSIPE